MHATLSVGMLHALADRDAAGTDTKQIQRSWQRLSAPRATLPHNPWQLRNSNVPDQTLTVS